MIKKIYKCLLIGSPVLYVVSCIYLSESLSGKFESIKIGDTKETVISTLGNPSHTEFPKALFSRYATNKCQEECIERLWFENKWSLDTEAWSFEIDKNYRVIKKYHWVSP